jgi:hypothetical protein
MRLPVGDVVRLHATALRERPGRVGLFRGLRDVPAAVRRRRRIPAWLDDQLRLLAGEGA